MWLVVTIIINDMIDNASAYTVIHQNLVVKKFSSRVKYREIFMQKVIL